ncbi:MAG: hypothetical protein NZ561_09135 [Phycisphaerae bacterium]|nr:hypothetical protein [Phycisphaerae bacterium]MDW8261263.1 calcium-binding protein [Phycisphaerales bacterium]
MDAIKHVEPLEARCLLAGVTLLAHGFEGNADDWAARVATGIVGRLGGPSAASVYLMKVDDSTGTLAVTAFAPAPGYGDYRNTSTAEVIIRLDWNAVSGPAFTTNQVAAVIANYLLLPRTSRKLPALVELPMHLIGHGRGASLVDELARILGRRGIIIDQTTYLDPDPIESYGDRAIAVWKNVVMADNYWRSDGDPQNAVFDGQSVAGAHEGDLNGSVGVAPGASAFNSTAAYYVGTVDLTTSDGGIAPINPNWYGTTNDKPARDATGYLYSRIGGGARPEDGLSPITGGTAPRSDPGQSLSQFPNIFALKPKTGTTFPQGTNFNISFRGSDRDGQASWDVYLDTDRNPYNGPGTIIASSVLTGDVDDFESSTTAGSAPAGKYVLASKIVDASGQTRWFYGRTIRISPPPPVGMLSGGVLRIEGSEGPDIIAASASSGQLIATLNDRSSTYNAAEISRIEVLAGGGNDRIVIDGSIPAYVDCGAGEDTAFGGDGDDTLTGGSSKNFLVGGSGNDRLNGSGSRDCIQGGAGDDRLYGNGGDDTLDGGGNVDRLFGGDGNDLLFGASSNDKLYGENGDDTLFGGAGSDILDGGEGNDSAEDREEDERIDIEILL